MRPHHLAAPALAAIAAALLAACGDEPAPAMTTTGEQVAESVVRTLEVQTGVVFEADCGDEEGLVVADDLEVPCTVVDPATGVEQDATAVLEIIGRNEGWRTRVEIAEGPSAASPTGPEGGSD
ncbi:hypothetical protein [Glycomyces tritici]|uniref:DUF4333 domain-containing protein n=1 Tax=Glycomyces tritici TaxID=2665176 RepID=A0ABT7YNI0_9ACTN|nr:hypothetical protein [Glycomyces tritici]MDN3239039.1 hypothetical protein [Glycomyces tritici]MDN3240201.1 hypothetical protein [Glycomyces tritici]